MPRTARLASLPRKLLHLLFMALGLAFMLLTGGCRLHEPARYERLDFSKDSSRLHVLFIGNSMTYYNDMPGLVQQLSAREAKPVAFEAVTFPLGSLEFHWDQGKATALLQKQKWDYVILQDFSRRPVTDPENSAKYFHLFSDAAKQAGAKVIVFQNWTRRGHDDEYSSLMRAYNRVLSENNATLAPIGAAWRMCERDNPSIKLLVDDRHPTDAGTYLTACVLYGTLYRKSPSALPTDLQGPKLPPSQIQTLRDIASSVLKQTAPAPR